MRTIFRLLNVLMVILFSLGQQPLAGPASGTAPVLSALWPSVLAAGGPGITLTLTGSGFNANSVVRWFGSARVTTLVSPTQLTAALTDADVATPGAASITVLDSSPGGSESAGLIFTVYARASLDTTADTVIGQPNFTSQGAAPAPGPASLSAAYATAIDSGGNLYVADTTNNRVLEFDAPLTDGKSASRVFGQPDFTSNGGSSSVLTATNLYAPFGVAVDSHDNLYIADSYHRRILEYDAPLVSPIHAGMPASHVLGGPDFISAYSGGSVTSSALASPVAVAVDRAGNIYVADNGWQRVTEYDAPLVDGKAASRVFGQPSLTAWPYTGAGDSQVSGPVSLALDSGGNLYIADAGNHRVLEFDAAMSAPLNAQVYANRVFGQPDFTGHSPNQGGAIGAATLNNPYAVAVDPWGSLYVADLGNNRVLRYAAPLASTTPGPAAVQVFGQNGSFLSGTGNNGGLGPASLAAPHGLSVAAGGSLVVADSGNIRVLVYDTPQSYPAPTVSDISPRVAAAGSPAFTLSVTGTGFGPLSLVRWNGSNWPSTMVNSTRLDAAIPALNPSANANSGVDVLNPAPGGGASTPPGGVVLHLYNRASSDVTADGVLGQPDFSSGTLNNPALPGPANRLSSPAAAAVDPISGRMFVADANNNRVLSWASSGAFANSQASDLVLGQPDFSQTGPNTGGLSGATLFHPSALAFDFLAGILYVADTGNHRVLGFAGSFSSGMAAFQVLGQGGSFSSGLPNNGGLSASSLSSPSGLAVSPTGGLFVADTGNHRVLYFDQPLNSAAAIRVFGQGGSFSAAAPNNGGVSAASLNGPAGLACDPITGALYVADKGNHRVLGFSTPYAGSAPSANLVFGQGGSFSANQANNGGISASSLNNPSALVVDYLSYLYVADSGNNRMLLWTAPLTSLPATYVFAQAGHFNSGDANHGGLSRDSLSAPAGLAVDASNNIYIADAGNQRLLEYDAPSGIPGAILSSISPSQLPAGGPGFTLTLNGSGFKADSQVLWNGAPLPTTFVSSTRLSAAVPAANILSGGPFPIAVQQMLVAGLPGQVSNAINLTLYTRHPGDYQPDGVLGQPSLTASDPNNPVLPGLAGALKQPSGVAIDPATGRLFVADTGNNRILSWPSAQVLTNGAPADLVIGQPNLTTTDPNHGGLGPASLNAPMHLAIDPQGNLWVVDRANYRVLKYTAPFSSGMSASLAIGQGSLAAAVVNFGGNATTPSATGLDIPFGIAFDAQGDLAVADYGNRRVLIFIPPFSTGMSASRVLGQNNSFTTKTKNDLSIVMGVAFDSAGNLYVADYGERKLSSQVGTFVFDHYQRLTEYNLPLTSDTTADNIQTFSSGICTGGWFSNVGDQCDYSIRSVAFDAHNHLYISGEAFDHNSQPNEKVIVQNVSSFQIGAVDEMAFDAAGDLLVANPAYNRVFEYDTPIIIPAPLPALSSLSPGIIASGWPAFTLTVNGTGFTPASVVRWYNADLPTTFLSPTQLTAAASTTRSPTLAPVTISVFTPGPGGGTSNPLSLVVYARTPLDPAADAVLGQPDFTGNLQDNPLLPGGANRLNLPRAGALDAHSGRLFVADTFHNRVLSWPSSGAFANSQAADLVIGQPDFSQTGPNTGGLGPAGLWLPQGVAVDSGGNLYVADTSNHRVLEYDAPLSTGMNASRIFGQLDYSHNGGNTSGSIDAVGLYGPLGLAVDAAGDLFVSDNGNHRVLEYLTPRALPFSSGFIANVVLGQPGFTTDISGVTDSASLWSPSGLALDPSGRLFVADTFNNRIVGYAPPFSNGMAASRVYGQGSFNTNRDASMFGVSPRTMLHPFALAFDQVGNLYVADTGWNRILEFDAGNTGINANLVFGQSVFMTSGAGVGTTGLNAPFGVFTDGAANLYVADSANHRLLEYAAPKSIPVPALTALSPDQVAAGSPAFTLTVNGSGFTSASLVSFNGASHATTYLSSTQLTILVAPTELASGGPFPVSVTTPAPGGGTSNTLNLSLYPRGMNDNSADLVLGQPNFAASTPANPLLPDGANRLDSPQAVVVSGQNGRIFVADANHNRILSWPSVNTLANSQAADLVLGQLDFPFTAANPGGVSGRSLFMPYALALDNSGNLYVADSGNHRVLEYDAPLATGMPASRVFGQGGSFTSNLPNKGGISAASLNQPQALALDAHGRLFIADTLNHRVLIFNTPLASQTADGVIGQPGFSTAIPNNGGVSASSLDWPCALAADSFERLFVADCQNLRVLEYFHPGSSPANVVYGQNDFTSVVSGIVNGVAPNGLAADGAGNLYVSDLSINRVAIFAAATQDGTAVPWTKESLSAGGPAHQTGPDRLFIPAGLALDRAGNLYVADSGNNRLLEYWMNPDRIYLPIIIR